MVKRLFIALLLMCATVATAHDFEVDGIYYNITDTTNNTVAVTHQGDSYNVYPDEYTNDVVIPNSVTYNGVTYSVTSIGYAAFAYCSGLTSVEIPNSVTSIGGAAFYGCSGLTSVVIPNSVTSIGNQAFTYCSSLKTVINLSNLTFSEGSSSYGYVAYYADKVINAPNGFIDGDFAWYENESGMTLAGYLGSASELTLPAYYKGENYAIGSYAFSDCSGLTSIEISNGVTSIGDYAFSNCSGLTSIIVESGNMYYDSRDNCNAVIETATNTLLAGCQNTMIPKGVTSIGKGAFFGCSGLTSIEIPNSVTNIGNKAFSGCSGLISIIVESGNMYYDSRDNCNAVIETATNTLLVGCQNTMIPNDVTSIGYAAFYNCSSLTSIEIPNSVTSIGDYAFTYCSGLTSVVIGNSVTSIGYAAFYNCSSLTSIEIPGGVTSIGDYAFTYCSGLASVEIPNSVTSIGYGAFAYCSGLTSVVIGNSVTSIGDYAFIGCSGLTSVVIGNSVASIGEGAFYGCKGLTSIEFNAENCTSMGNGSVFIGCYALSTVTIGENVKSIPSYAFYDCSSLTNVVIGKSVTGIGDNAFYDCFSLKTVINLSNLTFSEGSSSYGYVAFYADKVYNLPNGSIVGDFVFGKLNDVNTLVAYLGNATELTLPADYNGENYVIGVDVFKEDTIITSIVIPNSVTSIGSSAFYDCSSLKTVINFSNLRFSKGSSYNGYIAYYADKVINAPNGYFDGDYIWAEINGVKTLAGYLGSAVELILPVDCKGENYAIGSSVFSGCSGLTSIEIPNSVTSIGGAAFYGCSGLVNVVIGNSVTSIGSSAFEDCTALTSIEIPNSVTSIGDYAFYGCTGLSSVEIPNSVTSIREEAFKRCSNIESLYISNSIESIGYEAFARCEKIKEIKIGLEKPIRASESIFADVVYDDAILYVPIGAKYRYEKREPWNLFFDIVEMDFTGIDDVKVEDGEVKTVYDLNGCAVENPANGIYIIDGIKVLVK